MMKLNILTILYFLGLVIIYLAGFNSMNGLFIAAIILGIVGFGISYYKRMKK